MTTRLSTGVSGLDEVFLGGLLPGHVYLIRGRPGTGKTTLSMQFLLAGARRGEPVLFVTLTETEAELRACAAVHGWDLTGVHFLDIHPSDEVLTPDSQYSVFHPADVELVPTTRQITEAVERVRPARVVFDSLTEVRLLSRDLVRYRRQLLALKNYLLSQGATTLMVGESARPEFDDEIASIVHGVLTLSQGLGADGMDRRHLRVEKYRGSDFRAGVHALRIVRGGLEVFPRLVAPTDDPRIERGLIPSGIDALDRMLGGGLDRGTCSMIGGNSGVGKSTLGFSFLAAEAARGARGVVYSFDEWPAEVAYRCEAIGMPVRGLIERGLLHVQKVNPLGLTPELFAAWVQEEVERRETRLVMIDTVNGYELCTPDHGNFLSSMQQLVGYLKARGATLILVSELAQLAGGLAITDTGMSYLTDTTVLLRIFEADGALHKAIGVIRKRLGAYDQMFREFRITPRGMYIGEPLQHMRGILKGEAMWGEGIGRQRSANGDGGTTDG